MYRFKSLRLPFLVFIFSLATLAGCGPSRPGSPEEVADELVMALKTKDQGKYNHLLLSEKAMENLLEKSELDEAEKAEQRKTMSKEYNEEFKAEAQENWDKVLEGLKERGMGGEDLSIGKLEKEQEIRGNVQGAEVVLTLKSGGNQVKLAFTAIEDKGWWLLPAVFLMPE